MRVTLTQDELFEAISSHLRGKLNLDDSASIEISFTAGRGPKGYTADIDITYPKSELANKITAAQPQADDTASTLPGPVTDVAASATASATDLFSN